MYESIYRSYSQAPGFEISVETGAKSVARMSIFIGFLAATTLFVGFNFKIFKFVFKDNLNKYWWAFLLMSLIPLLLLIYIFALLFGGNFEFLAFS